jgi:integrase
MRYQKGRLYKTGNGWYVQYRNSEKKQVSHRLCDATLTKREVNQKWIAWQHAFNKDDQSSPDMKIAEFYETIYLPFARGKHKPVTVEGYEQLWKGHLSKHFGERTLQGYRTFMFAEYLRVITPGLSANTLSHIRSLASAIFSFAIQMGRLHVNPMREVKGNLANPKVMPTTRHYTIGEIEDIISALREFPDCQAIMALSFFAALRPGEIAGLRWDDVADGFVHVRRNIVRGRESTPKTKASAAPVPLIPQVIMFLELWRQKCGGPTEGWIFANHLGKPQDLHSLVQRIIRPTVTAAGLEWKSLYAGRRGAATAIIGLTNGNYIAAQELLRHTNATTTLKAYAKKTTSALGDGLKALSEAASPERAIEPEGSTE